MNKPQGYSLKHLEIMFYDGNQVDDKIAWGYVVALNCMNSFSLNPQSQPTITALFYIMKYLRG